MSLRYYYRNNDGDVVEMTNPRRVRRTGTEATASAEEGAVGTWDLEVDDPAGTFNVRGYRLVYAQETEAVADAQHGIIGVWYTGDRVVSRLAGAAPSKRTGAGRTWRLSLHDINTRLTWRLMIGGDTNTRPAGETDLETVAWLMGTNEMNWLDEDDTYIDTTDGVTMSGDRKYSGQSILDVLDDCAQTSGRNYGLLWEYSGDPDDPIAIKLWYKHGASEDYTSGKYLNNRLEWQTGDVLAPSLDAELTRSPSRVAWGVNQLYDGGSTYQTLQITADRFNKVDTTGRGENVKTEEIAIERAVHYLNTVANRETDRITVSTLVAKADVNSILPFHRLPVHFEHFPGYGELDEYLEPEYHYLRVVERTVRDVFADAYELGLSLMAYSLDDLTVPGPTYDTTLNAVITGISGPYPLPAGDVWFRHSGDDFLPYARWVTSGPFDFVMAEDGVHYLGIEVTADGTVQNVTMVGSYIGVALGSGSPYTVTMNLLHNGVAIASYVATVDADGNSSLAANPFITLTATDVVVSAGDVFSGELSCLPTAMAMFRSPLGINPGVGWNRLHITGGDF